MPLLQLNLLYIDSSEADAQIFRQRVAQFPGLDGFNVKFTHKTTMNAALQWLKMNRGGDTIVCFDPATRGIGERNIDQAVRLLKEIAESDRVFAMPASASSEDVWQRLRENLPGAQIFNKADVYHNGGMALLAKAAIDSMASRNSDGRRQMAIDMARIDGDSKLRDAEIQADLKLIQNEMKTISRDLHYLTGRMQTLDNTVFTSHPGTQILPLVEQVRSNQMGLAGALKSIDSLDSDIHDAVTLINGRMGELQERVTTMIEALDRSLEDLESQYSSNRTQIQMGREKFLFQYGWLILAVLASLFGVPVVELIRSILGGP